MICYVYLEVVLRVGEHNKPKIIASRCVERNISVFEAYPPQNLGFGGVKVAKGEFGTGKRKRVHLKGLKMTIPHQVAAIDKFFLDTFFLLFSIK